MNRGNSESHSIKQEVVEAVNHSNGVRALVMSAAMAFISGIFIAVVNLCEVYSEHSLGLTILLGIDAGVFVMLALLGFVLVRNREKDRIIVYYRGVYALAGAVLLVYAGLDLSMSGSMLLLFVCGMYMSLVPVLSGNERRIYLIGCAVGMIIALLAAKAGSRAVAEGIIIAAAMFFIGNIFQENAFSYERMSCKLKAKTISSESDPLTGLCNRRGLNRRASALLSQCVDNDTEVGLIEIDIDFFKKYNDKFGHPAGDKCLKMIANAIKEAAYYYGSITARTGGEEFMVFVQGLSEEELVTLALDIRSRVDEIKLMHAYAGVSQYVTVSIGVSYAQTAAENSFRDMYEEADKALYSAKSNGRHCVVCRDRIYGRMRKGLASVINS